MRYAGSIAIALLVIVAAPARAQFGLKAPQRLSVAADTPAKPVAAGERFALSVRIVPNPGIHVYAPGNPENIPVSVTVTAQAGLTADAPKFPRAEDFFFGPTAENLKVYTKPFVVTVPMKVDGAAAGKSAREVTVAGSVRYQACNDDVVARGHVAQVKRAACVRLALGDRLATGAFPLRRRLAFALGRLRLSLCLGRALGVPLGADGQAHFRARGGGAVGLDHFPLH